MTPTLTLTLTLTQTINEMEERLAELTQLTDDKADRQELDEMVRPLNLTPSPYPKPSPSPYSTPYP